MAIEAIGGKIQSEPLNRNFSYLDSQINKRTVLFEAEINTDITDDLNSLIEQGNIHVIIENGTFFVDAAIGIRPKDNTILEFSPNTILLAMPNNLSNYNVIRIEDVENVKIIDPVIYGERNEHQGIDGEWGMGISLRSAKNIEILNPKVYDCWGDGIYIGESSSKIPCENITIRNPLCDNNRRQGISVISVKGLLIENPVLQNTNGVAPAAGIDIEPNFNYQILQGVRITNLVTKNNENAGLMLALSALAGSTEPVDIFVNGVFDEGSQQGICVFGASGSVGGQINIENFTSKNNQLQGILSRNYGINFPHIFIRNIHIYNPNERGSTSVRYGSGITVYAEESNTNADPIGNITLENIEIIDDRTEKRIKDAIHVRDYSPNGPVARNVHILSPKKLDYTGSGLVQFYSDGRLEDPNNLLTRSLAPSHFALQRYEARKLIHNEGATTARVVTLGEVNDNFPPIIIEIREQQEIEIRPTNSLIFPITDTLGQAIASSHIGSRIELQKINGNWFVRNMVGTWSPK